MNPNYLYYREAAPAREIAHLVWSFWEFKVREDAPGPLPHEIFPDGCISLFYFCNKKYGYDGLVFNSLRLEKFTTEVQPGNYYWGMRLAPVAGEKILRRDPAGVADGLVADKTEHLTAGLIEKLRRCANFSEAIKAFENAMAALGIPGELLDERIARAVRLIEDSGGEIKVAELAAAAHLSTRQMERRFRKAAGLTPKQFIRARRIRAAAVSVVENAEMNWADRAAETGFTDQSHLTHEFVSLTGRSPGSFAENVGKIEHGDLL
ncbi:MAG TPA: AraC family transcriptional regulator [Pyrinomonadaceae bacterium]|jgi:AraC-like DNA-binding protein|nr:AraC family transcriptional regulator [Pyrinomonadaceae bacterium]